jgi:plastocyanin
VYRFWFFVHLAGVLGFLAAHGVSMGVTFAIRRERDPGKVLGMLTLSASSVPAMYISLGVLLLGGVVAGFLGHWWGDVWIWASIVVLLGVTGFMSAVASPYFRRMRVIASAKAEGSEAVTDEQFDHELKSSTNLTIAIVGIAAIALILYFMIFKPSFGFGDEGTPAPTPTGGNGALTIGAEPTLAFTTDVLNVPAGEAFQLIFDNQEPGVPHNVSIYTDQSATESLFQGDVVTGPGSVSYQVPALDPGEYFFRCDIHPSDMVGTVVAGGTGPVHPTDPET